MPALFLFRVGRQIAPTSAGCFNCKQSVTRKCRYESLLKVGVSRHYIQAHSQSAFKLLLCFTKKRLTELCALERRHLPLFSTCCQAAFSYRFWSGCLLIVCCWRSDRLKTYQVSQNLHTTQCAAVFAFIQIHYNIDEYKRFSAELVPDPLGRHRDQFERLKPFHKADRLAKTARSSA